MHLNIHRILNSIVPLQRTGQLKKQVQLSKTFLVNLSRYPKGPGLQTLLQHCYAE